MGEKKKPKFLRKEWHKKIKLGSKNKNKRKWRAAKGMHNKIRLERRGHQSRPKIGWGTGKKQPLITKIENLKSIENFKGKEILIGKVGLKKRKEIIAKANEKNIKILNKYKKIENAIK